MTNKERYYLILSRCEAAIDTIKQSEHTIVSESDIDVKENMYELSTNTLKYLLEVCFDEDDSAKVAYEKLHLEDYFKGVD